MEDDGAIHPSSFILHPSEESLAIRMGQTLRVDLELTHGAAPPPRVWIEAGWVRDDDRILAQARAPLELKPGLTRTRCTLRLGPWELTEGEWRLVLAVSPAEPSGTSGAAPAVTEEAGDEGFGWSAAGARRQSFDRLEVARPLRVTTPNPIELRVAMPIACRWSV